MKRIAAVDELAAGRSGVLCGHVDGRVAATPLADVVGKRKAIDPRMLELARVLAR